VEKAIQHITSKALKSTLPGFNLFDKIFDSFATREKIRVIVSSPDFQELTLLFGALTWTKGSRRELLIEGGPRFCEAALRDIEKHSKGIEVITHHLRPQVPWYRRLLGTGQ
jgi:hypothetical protein